MQSQIDFGSLKRKWVRRNPQRGLAFLVICLNRLVGLSYDPRKYDLQTPSEFVILRGR